jgi:hypothetical protein
LSNPILRSAARRHRRSPSGGSTLSQEIPHQMYRNSQPSGKAWQIASFFFVENGGKSPFWRSTINIYKPSKYMGHGFHSKLLVYLGVSYSN